MDVGGLRRLVASTWRRILGQSGRFTSPEISERAGRLSRGWDERWGLATPDGASLRWRYPHRWFRIWTLPEGKTDPDDQSDREEITRRQFTLLSELNPAGTAVVLIAEDYDWADLASGWSRKLIPHAWPWRIHSEPDEAGHPPIVTYFWAKANVQTTELEPLLQASVTDEARILIMPEDVSWILAPYYAGIDVFVTDDAQRTRLRTTCAGWLSDRPDGL